MKNQIWIIVILIGVIMLINTNDAKKESGEIVICTAPSFIGTGEVLEITCTPTSTAQLASWTLEGIEIPSGWAYAGKLITPAIGDVTFCKNEAGVIQCVSVSDTVGDISPQIILKFTAPTYSQIDVEFSGQYLTLAGDSSSNTGNILLYVDVDPPSCTPSTIPENCGVTTSCVDYSCVDGDCVSTYASEGYQGDTCDGDYECDGSGSCVEKLECSSDSGCLDDITCRDYYCDTSIGECKFIPQGLDDVCGLDLGGFGTCNDLGDCIGCSVDTDCGVYDDLDCETHTCTSNVCVHTTLDSGEHCETDNTPSLDGTCQGGYCTVPTCDCGSYECGVDPVCQTLNCGTCGAGTTCNSYGQCIDNSPTTTSTCEFYEQREGGKCVVAPWVWVVGIFMAFILFISVLKN